MRNVYLILWEKRLFCNQYKNKIRIKANPEVVVKKKTTCFRFNTGSKLAPYG